jgi:Dolichyl-phosphate-mannose-protein mannosyltransferase
MHYKKKVLLLIAIASIARIIIANSVYLGVDEVYYRQYANTLEWNYFDHPPMVAWLIRITTLNLWLDTDINIRLGAILCAAITTWIIYLCGKIINNERTGYYAAILYSVNIYTSIIAGTFILPDSPQMLLWGISIYLLLLLTSDKKITQQKKKWLLYFAFTCGVGILCKVHSVFLWFGLLLYIIQMNKRWLRQPILYYAGCVTLLFTIPILYWNIANDFITFQFHGNRVNVNSGKLNFTSFAQFNIGQFFYQNPIITVLIVMSSVAFLQKKITINVLHQKVLYFTAFPLIIVAFFISFFKEVLPHWTGPAFFSLQLLTAVWLDKKSTTRSVWGIPKVLHYAGLFLCLVILAGVLSIHYLPKTLGSKEYPNLGSNDFTLDMYGWSKTKIAFEKIYKKNSPANSMIICNAWFPAAHIQQYIATPLQLPLIALGAIDKIHQYHWWNKTVAYKDKPLDAYLIIPSNYNFDWTTITALSTNRPNQIDTIFQYRSNVLINYFTVYYFKNISIP